MRATEPGALSESPCRIGRVLDVAWARLPLLAESDSNRTCEVLPRGLASSWSIFGAGICVKVHAPICDWRCAETKTP